MVCTTSGTAAAELHPAVVEAHHAGVPLLVCTADRPSELHDVGAPQTIDQARLFGRAVRWFAEPGVPVAEVAGTWRSLAARSVAEAREGPYGPGPVHLNLAFRDPLVAEHGPLPEGRLDGGPLYGIRAPGGPEQYGWGRGWGLRPLVGEPGHCSPGGEIAQWAGCRGLMVVGQGCGPPAEVLALAERLGWPVLADPRSGCRVIHPNVVAAADALARPRDLRSALQPDVVLLLGSPWASRALAEFLAEAAWSGAKVVAVDPWWRWIDPDRIVSEVYRADPGAWVRAALAGLGETVPVASEWVLRWQTMEEAAQRVIDEVLADDAVRRGGALTEPALARRLLPVLPMDAQVVVSSSMPVRELEWFAPPLASPPVLLANRGANGIDGVCSTAQGVAAAGLGPVVGLVGDLAFFHDVSSLLLSAMPSPPASCTLVVVDNGGGGIFNFLPQAMALDPARFEQLFGTPQAPDIAAVARGFGLETAEASTLDELQQGLETMVGRHRLAVVIARVPDRVENVAFHDRIHEAIGHAVRAVLEI